MRKILGLAGATLLFAGSASAADLLKAPAMPLGPVASWTGWYIGATAGYGWTNQGIDNHVTSAFCNVALTGCRAIDHPNAAEALVAAIPPHLSTNPKGFIGGGEIGYNQQVGQFVWGVEADVSGASIKGSDVQAGVAPFSVAPGVNTNAVAVGAAADQKLDFFATLRGRLGFLVMPTLLAYGTGGFAFGHVSTTTALAEIVGGPCSCGPFPVVAASSSATLPGWTVGGGLEWMIAPQWSVKGEYLYYDLGTLSTPLSIVQTNGAGTPFFGATVGSSAVVKGNIVRAGVNFHF
jgi:outer membrane immunogenic protein